MNTSGQFLILALTAGSLLIQSNLLFLFYQKKEEASFTPDKAVVFGRDYIKYQ